MEGVWIKGWGVCVCSGWGVGGGVLNIVFNMLYLWILVSTIYTLNTWIPKLLTKLIQNLKVFLTTL